MGPEQNYPVAAAERGRCVLVGPNETFEVADHDFTKFSVVPSVSFVIKIPETVEGSWYEGEVHVGLQGCSLSTFICCSSCYQSPFNSNVKDWQQKHSLCVY